MKPNSKKKRLTTSVNNVVLFPVTETEPTSVNNVVIFLSYGDRLLNPFNYCSSLVTFNTIYSIGIKDNGIWNKPNKQLAQCSETSIQQKRLHTSVKNVVLFSVMETEPTSVNNVVLFSVMETDYLTPLITVALWYLLILYIV